MTLTQDEEGTLFWYNPGRGDGIHAINDNGTVTQSSTATNPVPFPLLVHEDDPSHVDLVVASASANDRWSVYALVEEWLVL
jgi:hypothetical protein